LDRPDRPAAAGEPEAPAGRASGHIDRLGLDSLPAELRSLLLPKVERLGYLGEFFQVAGHQPDALGHFVGFTEALKQALPFRLTELVALSVSTWSGNDYERHQHEQLCLAQGLAREWIEAIERLAPAAAPLEPEERLAQELTLAMLERTGRGARALLERLVSRVGPAIAVGILLCVGRYIAHASFTNVLELAPPVPSPLPARPEPAARPAWIRESDVNAILDMPAAIAALREGIALEADGKAANLHKTHLLWEGGHTLHALGAAMPGAQRVGVKAWAHTGGGATPLAILWDAEDGRLVAVIEAFALGQLRTAAASGLATDLMADAAADELALCGTGKQALPQVAAVAAVRRLRRVRVYGRDAVRRAAFAERVSTELGVFAESFDTAQAALRDAPIVTLVTRATEPFVDASMLCAGAHVNALGAITPERSEFAGAVLDRCGLVVADSPEAVRRLSCELREHWGDDEQAWSQLRSLSSLLVDRDGRRGSGDLTLFKAMGMGISDLALALAVERGARARNLGDPISPPRRDPLRLRPIEEDA
jgi:ornithine cyclodeaminase